MAAGFPNLVSTEWLAAHLQAGDVKIVDASEYLPTDNRDPAAEFIEAHIPGAVFMDLNAVSDPDAPLPHTLPSAERFGAVVGGLGIGNDDRVVVYDTAPGFSAPRGWWLFQYFGHEMAAVLDGGLPKWRREGRPLQSGPQNLPPKPFKATAHPEMAVDLEAVRQALATNSAQIIDARGAPRFEGRAPEPRPGVRSGHMPGARNLPYNMLLAEDGTFVDGNALRQRFEEAGVDLDAPVITTCGSGVTAAVLTLGLVLLGKDARLYDGSWTEWGGRADTPVETGPAGQTS